MLVGHTAEQTQKGKFFNDFCHCFLVVGQAALGTDLITASGRTFRLLSILGSWSQTDSFELKSIITHGSRDRLAPLSIQGNLIPNHGYDNFLSRSFVCVHMLSILVYTQACFSTMIRITLTTMVKDR